MTKTIPTTPEHGSDAYLRTLTIPMLRALDDVDAGGFIDARALARTSLTRALVSRGLIARDERDARWALTEAGEAVVRNNCAARRHSRA